MEPILGVKNGFMLGKCLDLNKNLLATIDYKALSYTRFEIQMVPDGVTIDEMVRRDGHKRYNYT